MPKADNDTRTRVINMILESINAPEEGDEGPRWLRLITCRQRCMRLPGVGSQTFQECVAFVHAVRSEGVSTEVGRLSLAYNSVNEGSMEVPQ
jgi:hypothetical protein